MAAVGALIEMAAQRGGAATLDRRQHFEMPPAEPATTRLDETLSGGADQIGQFQSGTLHELLSATPPYPIRPMMLTCSHAKRLPSGFVQIAFAPSNRSLTSFRSSCSSVPSQNSSSLLDGHELITTRLTWTEQVSRSVHKRCVTCHQDGGSAPMPLETYAQV